MKDKILTGFPCNNNTAFAVMTKNNGILITKNKEEYTKVMKEGYIEISKKEE